MILYLKHISIEGPGTLEAFFSSNGCQSKVIELDQGQSIPSSLEGVEAVVVLGGPMNVYEEDRYSYLNEENMFIQDALNDDIPLLGICLGAQLLAKACGAKIKKASQKEVGWSRVTLTSDGQNDPLFKNVPLEMDVFQWHEDTFEIPDGGQLLSTSPTCKHQAFRVSNRAYGLQFHVEVTEEIIAAWIQKYWKVESGMNHPQGRLILEQTRQLKTQFDRQANLIYNNLLNIIKKK